MGAVAVQCRDRARQGFDEVLGCLGDADSMGLSGFITMLVQTHVVHAHRRWEEMGLVAQTLRETGVDPLMTEAIEKSHRRTVDAHIAPADVMMAFSDLAEAIEKCPRGCGHLGPPSDPDCALDELTGHTADRVAATRRLLTAMAAD